MYWSDWILGTIHRASLDGSSPETVLTGLGQVFGLAVDAIDAKIYWTQVGLVRRADLDGTNREDLVTITDGNGEGRAIALDLTEAKMYYSIAAGFMGGPEGDSKIFRAGLDGSGEEAIVVLGGNTFNRQIALDPLNEGQDPDECDPPVPALSTYGVAVLTLLLLVAMTAFIARRVERAGGRP